MDTTEAILLAAVFSFFAPLIWNLVNRGTDAFVFWISLRTRNFTINLESADVPEEITKLKYILVRYGNDQFIERMASDREKFQGRLRNKIVDVDTHRHGSTVNIRLKIPIHTSLGTQFKFFVECNNNPDAVVKYLESQKHVCSVSHSSKFDNYRVYFLIDRFEIVKSVEGFKNNMIYPE